jgi:hypothetical protein
MIPKECDHEECEVVRALEMLVVQLEIDGKFECPSKELCQHDEPCSECGVKRDYEFAKETLRVAKA